ncbi:WD repeat domain 3 [Thecamonas trahens ATCC 50062]|uniref:WD repeat domain 3 n=1 Tax=Thecamonas trahens ATCC 50062 TaxID=461836 RepID=A0A0L0DC68_THETB|nr:WD repeat domain 3 [Thecamonas trahens ATCC 50062]KNC49676.1 WD repeat domain 3 [Thecamonas trahens ATCC 50062]|eukprot:XP_013757473.1 WD repeat domain 3 [Thecamonas trahens ATCC 50062]
MEREIAMQAKAQAKAISDMIRRAVSAALEQILVWDIRRGSLEGSLGGGESNVEVEVTSLILSSDASAVFAGYADGSLRVWDLASASVLLTFNGHKSATTCLAEGQGSSGSLLLASGSKDTDIIVWDVVGEEGLYRLRGHKDMITAVALLSSSPRLVSASKDSLVKVWDLESQSCIQTLVGHRAQVWSLTFSPDESRMISGAVDACLRVWDAAPMAEGGELGYMGRIDRASTDRVLDLSYGYGGKLVLAVTAEKMLEIFRVRDPVAVEKKIARRLRRRREKATKAAKAKAALAEAATVMMVEGAEAEAAASATETDPELRMLDGRDPELPMGSDEIASLLTIRLAAKVRSASFAPPPPSAAGASGLPPSFSVLVALANNSLEEYRVDLTFKELSDAAKLVPGVQPGVASAAYTRTGHVARAAHATDIRALSLSRNDDMLASGSADAIKVWNMSTFEVIRDLPATQVLALAFVPGDRHLLAGTKDGGLLIFDLRTAALIDAIQAHEGAVWAIRIHPSGNRLVTASADAELKCWDFELAGTGLGLVHTRTLKMTDDVLGVVYSGDGKTLAVALLDATVKLFFEDSLKFMLSLYGHKLPVLSLDFSSDGELIATGSADKNIKLWGAAFGDCHKSIFAHDDSVMQVAFVRRTHYLFSVGKDGLIKYWDADTYDCIQILRGHHAEVWTLALSRLGDVLVTGSHDKSLRVWRRTEEQLFLEEEREAEAELELASDLAKDAHREAKATEDSSAAYAGKATLASVKDGERLLEAVDLAVAESYKFVNPDKPTEQPSPLLLGLTPSAYLLRALASIPHAHLEEALMVMPFSAVMHVLHFLEAWIVQGSRLELCCRTLNFLLVTHRNQIAANSSLLLLVRKLKSLVDERLRALRDTVGFNLAAISVLQAKLADAKTVSFAKVDTAAMDDN